MAGYMTRCPNCGKYRRTSSVNYIKCFSCGKGFNAKTHYVSETAYKKAVSKEVGFT